MGKKGKTHLARQARQAKCAPTAERVSARENQENIQQPTAKGKSIQF